MAKKKKKSKHDWLWEFSKRIVWIVTVLFVLTFLYGAVLLVFYPDSTAIQYLIERISHVFEVTVVSYAVKAGFENVFKIRRNNNGVDSEQLGVSADYSNGSDGTDLYSCQ